MHHNSSLPSLFAPTASTSAIPATPHFTATHPPSSPSPINGDDFELLRTPSAPTTQPLADPSRLLALAHLATVPLPPITAPSSHRPETCPGTLVPSSSALEGPIFQRSSGSVVPAQY